MNIPPRPIDLEALVRAHPFITIERPPELWQPDADDVSFIRFFGQMLVAALARNGNELAAVTVNVSNVVVDSAAAGPMPPGELVAITAFLDREPGAEMARVPDAAAAHPMISRDLESAAADAGAAWAYTRTLAGGRGSVTVLFRRRG